MAINIHIRVDDKQAAQRIRAFSKKAGANVKDLEKQTTKSTNIMNKAFKRIGVSLAAYASIRGIGQLIGSMANFEKTMAEVSTIVDTNVVNMKSLNKQILHLSTIVPQSAQELGAGLYETISAGITDTGEAIKFLGVASKLAVAGVSDTKTTVDALTTVINAYGLSASDVTKVSDVMFKTVEAGKTKINLLAGSIGNVASSAALSGVTFEELSAAIAIMTKATGQTDETMTALNRLFLSITNATPQVIKNAADLGIEWTASALRGKHFAKFMEELTTALQKDQNAIFDLGLDMRAFKSLAILGGKSAKEFADQINEMKNTTDATETAFQKMNKTTDAQWKLFKNQLNVSVQKLGSVILPIATSALMSFNQQSGNAVEKLRNEQIEFNALVDMLKDTNIEQDTRNKTIAALQGQYPDYIKNIDLEKASTEELNKMQKKVNQSVLDRILLMSQEEKFKEFTDKLVNIKTELMKAEKKLRLAYGMSAEAAIKAIENENNLTAGMDAHSIKQKELGQIILNYRDNLKNTKIEFKEFIKAMKEMNIDFTMFGKPSAIAKVTTNSNKIAKNTEGMVTSGLTLNEIMESQETITGEINRNLASSAKNQKVMADEANRTKENLFEEADALNQILQMASGKQKFSFSSLLQVGAIVASLVPGGQGVAAGLQAASIATRGFQHGGSFMASGPSSGYTVPLTLHGDEKVDITPKNQTTNNNNATIHFHFNMADEFTIKNKVIPIINKYVTRQGGKLMASGVA